MNTKKLNKSCIEFLKSFVKYSKDNNGNGICVFFVIITILTIIFIPAISMALIHWSLIFPWLIINAVIGTYMRLLDIAHISTHDEYTCYWDSSIKWEDHHPYVIIPIAATGFYTFSLLLYYIFIHKWKQLTKENSYIEFTYNLFKPKHKDKAELWNEENKFNNILEEIKDLDRKIDNTSEEMQKVRIMMQYTEAINNFMKDSSEKNKTELLRLKKLYDNNNNQDW